MGARSGAEYVEGLRDGREVWIDGERVKDVTRDRRLARGIRSVAALYDRQLDPALVEQMTYRSPTTGDRVGLSHIQPRSVEDLVRRRSMIKTWAEWSAGMMGRSPDFLNTMIMGCAANADYWWKPGNDFVGDPPQEEQGLYSVFDSDVSSLLLIKEYADKLQAIKR